MIKFYPVEPQPEIPAGIKSPTVLQPEPGLFCVLDGEAECWRGECPHHVPEAHSRLFRGVDGFWWWSVERTDGA